MPSADHHPSHDSSGYPAGARGAGEVRARATRPEEYERIAGKSSCNNQPIFLRTKTIYAIYNNGSDMMPM